MPAQQENQGRSGPSKEVAERDRAARRGTNPPVSACLNALEQLLHPPTSVTGTHYRYLHCISKVVCHWLDLPLCGRMSPLRWRKITRIRTLS